MGLPKRLFLRRHRHLTRYRQIILVLARNGFGLLFEQIGIYRYLRMRPDKRENRQQRSAELARLSLGERLRRSSEELGPTFVKIGQILSTRPDLLSPEITGELEKLQESVHPFSYEAVQRVIREDFDQEPDQLFARFDPQPLAAASLSQVHRASLAGGLEVAVKIQRPDIDRQVAIDLEILEDFLTLLVKHTPYGSYYDFLGMLQELKTSLTRELDFRREGENADRFRRNHQGVAKVAFPRIHWVYTTRRVLTMSYEDGIRITQAQALKEAGIDGRELGTRLAQTLVQQILKDGFFHADPHPGNLAIRPDGTIVFLDLGMTGSLTRTRRRQLSRMFIGISSQNAHQVVATLAEMGTIQSWSKLKPLEQEIDQLFESVLSVPISQLDIGSLLAQLFRLAYQYRIRIPGELTLMAKVLLTLQSDLDLLDRNLNLMTLMKPMARRLIWEIWSFEDLEQAVGRSAHDVLELARQTPQFLLNLQQRLAEDDYTVQLGIRNLDAFHKQLDRITNRLSFSIILLAVCLVIAGIIIGVGFSAGRNPEMDALYRLVLRIGLGVAGVVLSGLLLSMIRSRKD